MVAVTIALLVACLAMVRLANNVTLVTYCKTGNANYAVHCYQIAESVHQKLNAPSARTASGQFQTVSVLVPWEQTLLI